MTSHEIPSYPFQHVFMDVFTTDFEGKSQNLITVDHYSDFFELDILKDMTHGTLIGCCKKNFSRHELPARICSDNGINFNSKEFKLFC